MCEIGEGIPLIAGTEPQKPKGSFKLPIHAERTTAARRWAFGRTGARIDLYFVGMPGLIAAKQKHM
jgi:hypothetical protein